MLSLPETSLLDVPQNRLTRWQLIQQSIQSFWKQWSSSYLQSLMQRNKWTNPAPIINVGDTVLLKGMTSSPLNWPIGRIMTLCPGRDGISRIAKIKVSNTILTRPLTSLIRFPIEQ
uniref:DUF5641 domain-containing protein n=1 Tax=Photinus pyralis TaxID=7054 RepID=A0A1Y1LN50_PHOPY